MTFDPAAWHWGTWTETVQLGTPEWKAVALAHAIILFIAFIRYRLRPWWMRRRERSEARSGMPPSNPADQR